MANTINTFKKEYGVHITTGHEGKMHDIYSLSTSVLLNPICRKRAAVKGSICEHCFAEKLANQRSQLAGCIAKNTEILTSEVIPVKAWPLLNQLIFRFESFGDLNNATQVINYFNFARRNPRTTFALWTKNPEFIAQAIADGHKKPRNLIIIQSSAYVDKVDAPKFDFIDKVFTVYSKQGIAGGAVINCGARDCLSCRRCYTKKRGVEYIAEKLK